MVRSFHYDLIFKLTGDIFKRIQKEEVLNSTESFFIYVHRVGTPRRMNQFAKLFFLFDRLHFPDGPIVNNGSGIGRPDKSRESFQNLRGD